MKHFVINRVVDSKLSPSALASFTAFSYKNILFDQPLNCRFYRLRRCLGQFRQVRKRYRARCFSFENLMSLKITRAIVLCKPDSSLNDFLVTNWLPIGSLLVTFVVTTTPNWLLIDSSCLLISPLLITNWLPIGSLLVTFVVTN